MRQEDWDREQMELDRQALIDEVAARIEAGDSATDIVDMIIARLTPADGAECPVCGIQP